MSGRSRYVRRVRSINHDRSFWLKVITTGATYAHDPRWRAVVAFSLHDMLRAHEREESR